MMWRFSEAFSLLSPIAPLPPRRVLQARRPIDGSLVVVVGIGFIIAGMGLGARLVAEVMDLKEVERDYHRVEQVIDGLSGQVRSIDDGLADLRSFEQRMRVLADLDDRVAMGHAPGEDQSLPLPASLDPELADRLQILRTSLNHAEAEVEFRLDGFEEAEEALETKRESFAHIPSVLPAEGWISAAFGHRDDPFTGRRAFHKGIDVAANRGTDIVASARGVVTFSGRNGSYGNQVRIDHGNGYVTSYSHNDRNLVRRGEPVERGDAIALVGSTGRSTSSHVHYEVIYEGKRLNPWRFLIPDGVVVD